METFRHSPNFEKYAENEAFLEFATPGAYPPGKVVTDPVAKVKSLIFTGVWISYPKIGHDIMTGSGDIYGNFQIRAVDEKFQLTFEAQESFTRDYVFAALEKKGNRFLLSVHRQWFDWANGKTPFGRLDCGAYDNDIHTVSMVFHKDTAAVQFDTMQKMIAIPPMANIRVDSARLRSYCVVGGIVPPFLYIHGLDVVVNS